MTEIDAFTIAKNDAQEAVGRMESAQSPMDLERIFTQFLLYRASHIDSTRLVHVIEEACARPSPAHTLSGRLAHVACRAMEIALRTIEGEDAIALTCWCVGVPDRVEGFVQPVFAAIADPGHEQAIVQCERQGRHVIEAVQQQNHYVLHELSQRVPHAVRRHVRLLVVDSRRAAAELDGETARNDIVQAKKLVLRFLKATDATPPEDPPPAWNDEAATETDDVRGALFGA